MPQLPEVVETERLVLRLWKPDEAAVLRDAVTESIEHLRPWMEWIAFEPLDIDARRELIEGWRRDFDAGGDAVYGVFIAESGAAIGGTGLHNRVGPGGIEIGYWIHVDHCGRGYATELSEGLTNAAFAIEGIDRVEIHTDKANEISARVPVRLGYALTAETKRPPVAPGEIGINQQWTMRHDTWRSER